MANTEKPEVTVVSGKSRHFGKKELLVAAVVLLVVLGGVAFGFMQKANKPKSNDGSKEPTAQQVSQAVDEAFASGNYDKAIETLKSQPESTQKQLLLATAYVNKRDYKSALDIYAKLDSEGQLSSSHMSGAADVAEVAKDYKLAIKYHQKAKELVLAQKDQRPNWQGEVALHDAAIKRLQGL